MDWHVFGSAQRLVRLARDARQGCRRRLTSLLDPLHKLGAPFLSKGPVPRKCNRLHFPRGMDSSVAVDSFPRALPLLGLPAQPMFPHSGSGLILHEEDQEYLHRWCGRSGGRAEALLRVAAGEPIPAVAAELGVATAKIEELVDRASTQGVRATLAGPPLLAPRRGRGTSIDDAAWSWLVEVARAGPSAVGLTDSRWTARSLSGFARDRAAWAGHPSAAHLAPSTANSILDQARSGQPMARAPDRVPLLVAAYFAEGKRRQFRTYVGLELRSFTLYTAPSFQALAQTASGPGRELRVYAATRLLASLRREALPPDVTLAESRSALVQGLVRLLDALCQSEFERANDESKAFDAVSARVRQE